MLPGIGGYNQDQCVHFCCSRQKNILLPLYFQSILLTTHKGQTDYTVLTVKPSVFGALAPTVISSSYACSQIISVVQTCRSTVISVSSVMIRESWGQESNPFFFLSLSIYFFFVVVNVGTCLPSLPNCHSRQLPVLPIWTCWHKCLPVHCGI